MSVILRAHSWEFGGKRRFFYFLGCVRWNANTFTQTVITYGWVQRKKCTRRKEKREHSMTTFILYLFFLSDQRIFGGIK